MKRGGLNGAQRLNGLNFLNSLPDRRATSAPVTTRLVGAFVDIEKNVGYGLTPSRDPEFENSPTYPLSDWVEKFELIRSEFFFFHDRKDRSLEKMK
jgi:hypothetical protein